jgi:uncharacterized protein (TIGR03437 family)
MIPPRNASTAEDPANRRAHGGGKQTFNYAVIPRTRPDVVLTPAGPAIAHSRDFTPVSSASPATSGEIVALFATGLGPVRTSIAVGQSFAADPLAAVNSPVEVLVNGTPAEVLAAVGLPGSTDRYQVNFRVPAGIVPGTVLVQLISGWIPGSPVPMPVR